ncbi:MAG TPA: ABC transporter substrate-binding protein [Hyphomicrobiales bacterium]|nr:ABC transporter substrate-binding protein [Hyphomicrobiales bacterium]
MFDATKRAILAIGAFALLASPALAEGAPWHIGFISATSGPLKDVGDSTETAVKLAVKEINAQGGVEGRPLDFIQYDTAADPKQASVGVRTLAEDRKVLAIVGPLSSAQTAVAMNDAERLKILMLPYSSSAPGLIDGKTFTWRLSATEDKQFTRLLTSMKRKGIATKTADIIYVSDDRIANVTGTKVYPPLLRKAGVDVLRSVSMNINSFDVSAQVAQIMQDKPDVVALAANFSQAVTALRELRRQHFAGRVIGSQLFADPNLVGLFGKDADGMLFVSGFWRYKNAKTEAFSDRFMQAMVAAGYPKRSPHHVDAQAYDTVFLLKKAIETSHVTGDPAKLAEERIALRDALKGLTFSGVLASNICFNGNSAELPGYIIEVKNGEWSLFDEFPPDACKAG